MSLPARLLDTDPDVKNFGGKIKKLKYIDQSTKSNIDPNEKPKIKKLLQKGYSPTAIFDKLINGSDNNRKYVAKIAEEENIKWNSKTAQSGTYNGNYGNPTNYKHKNNYTTEQINSIFSFKKDNHWNWQGGVGPYPSEFNNLIRFFIQVMDNFSCNYCDRPGSEIGYCHVHHIDGDKNNTCVDNLCLICKRCHLGQAHKKLLDDKHNLYTKVENNRRRKWQGISQKIKEIVGKEKLQIICQTYTTSPLCEFQILEHLLGKAMYLEKKN